MRCRRLARALLIMLFLLGCGQVRSVPPELNLADYTPVELGQLQQRAPGLQAGQLVRVQAYFWEFLSYDPVPQHYYFNNLRHPRRWRELEWFALYQEAAMRGYFDQAAMSYEQRLQFQPNRLEPLLLYGELVPMGGGRLYFLTHHLERVVVD